MPAPLFKDINKPAKDLLTKDLFYSNKVEFHTTSDNGAQFVTNAEFKGDGAVSGSLKNTQKFKEHNAEVTATLESSGSLKVDASVSDKLVDGLKVATSVKTGSNDFSISTDYKSDQFTLSDSFSRDKDGKNSVSASALYKRDAWCIGGEVEYDLSGGAVKKSGGAVSYDGGDFALTTIIKSMDSFVGSYSHKLNDDLTVAAQASFGSKPNNSLDLQFGAQYKLDKDTTVKARLETSGKVAATYTQQISDLTKLSISTAMQADKLGATEGHAFGWQLTVKK